MSHHCCSDLQSSPVWSTSVVEEDPRWQCQEHFQRHLLGTKQHHHHWSGVLHHLEPWFNQIQCLKSSFNSPGKSVICLFNPDLDKSELDPHEILEIVAPALAWPDGRSPVRVIISENIVREMSSVQSRAARHTATIIDCEGVQTLWWCSGDLHS